MQIRLHGTTAEIDATLAALRSVLVVRSVSRPYPDRPPSLSRCYLETEPTSTKDGGGYGPDQGSR